MDRPYGHQLADKQASLKGALAAAPGLDDFSLAAPHGSARRFGYRNHAKLVFRSRRAPTGGRETILGVYRPGTHSVVPADRCPVHDTLMQPLLRGLRGLVEERGVPIYDERRRVGELRYALVRSSRMRGSVHLTLISATPDPAWLAPLLHTLQERYEGLESAFLCTNPTPGNTLLSSDIRRLFGPTGLLERIGGRVLESRPDAFLQANPDVAGQLYRAAARELRARPGATIADLYCGVGGLGLALARAGDRLVGIEASETAVACARANARRARVGGANFVCAPAQELRTTMHELGVGGCDVVVTNPPRRGMGAAVVEQIAELAPAQILYISCEPTTLKRDLDDLSARGYSLIRAQAFDMLPHTPHVETLAVLSRRDVRG